MNQISFISEYKEYMELGSLGTNLNFIRFHMLQKVSIGKLPAQDLVTICSLGEASSTKICQGLP